MILSFINDEVLEKAVKHVLNNFNKAVEETNIHKNSLDPFSAFLEASFSNDSFGHWSQKEKQRQAQKTFQNAIGDFHQMVLGGTNGWEDMGKGGGLDVVCKEKKIVAEIKNKHNTMNAGNAVDVYDKIADMLSRDPYHDYTGYCVKIIPKSKKGILPKEFAPSDSKTQRKRVKNPRILQIDGKRFYALAADDEDALEKVFDALPKIIERIQGKSLSKNEIESFKKIFNRIY